MSAPRRIQLRRTKGWRKPPEAVVVARPTKWGNPFTIDACLEAGFASDTERAREICVEAFRDWLNGNGWAAGHSPDWPIRRRAILDNIHELRGKDLACWCRPDKACHADVLLKLANADPDGAAP